MKKIIILTSILFLLLIIVFFWLRAPRDTFAGEEETQFAYEHLDDIQRIYLADWGQNEAELVRQPNGKYWNYTNKKSGKTFMARPDAIQNLLETIGRVRVRMRVGEAAVPNVTKSMAGTSRKVQLYDGGGKLLRSYSVGGAADSGDGTYMLMDGAQRPCVVYLPSWVGSVHTRFIVSEEQWRDRALFRVVPKELEMVQVEYHDPLQMQHSFKILRTGAAADYTVEAVSSVTKLLAGLNKDNVATYIDDFDVIVAESLIYDYKLRDSVLVQKPFATVRYKITQDTQERAFRLYPVFNPGANRGDGLPGMRQKMERYYADVDADHFFLVQHPVIQRVLWGYSYFFQQEKVVLPK